MAFVELESSDGFRLGAWESSAKGELLGTVVVLQEIFGVNHHIQTVCDRLAGAGYDAVAPALFDRHQRDFVSGYSAEEIKVALNFLPMLNWNDMVLDTLAAVRHARKRGGRVAVLGFCVGASVAYLAAQRESGIAAVVGYYGGQIVHHLDQPPQSPTLLHYGESDHTIPMADVERIRLGRPDCELHTYPVGHGFNCDERGSYDPAAAALAWDRTMQWLSTYLVQA
jgi:carboxymethylenebutenolidase